jgi:protein transport protein SEC24
MTRIPTESSKITEIGLPLSALWHPLAELKNNEESPAQAEGIPFRCSRCLAYVNPYFRFSDGGRKVVCNICGLSQDCPEVYQRDKASRVELYRGTYDFIAPGEYSNRPAQMPLFLFCVDVSAGALQLGLVQQVVSSIQAILDYLPFPDKTLIGLVTFDCCLQSYKLLNNGELLEIVMNDVEDPFVPEPVSGLCFNVESQREVLDLFLSKMLEKQFNPSSKQVLSLGALLTAVKNSILKSRGGRVIVFTSQNGLVGKNSLSNKGEPKFSPHEKDKSFLPAESFFTLSQELASEDICVDIFTCDSATNNNSLAVLSSQTGGDLHFFPNYKSETDGERVYYLIARILTRPSASQVVMRARCSNGLSVDHYVGKFKRRGPVEMEVAGLDSDKALAIVLKYDEKLVEGDEYHVQCAMLFTDQQGRRLIRIFNGKVSATKSVPNIFKAADPEVINSVLLKISAAQVFEQSLNSVREAWHSNIIKVLLTHRITLGDADNSKILVPEELKLLPLYCSCSLKVPGITLAAVSSDSRLASIHAILGMSAFAIQLLVYPSVYSIHDIMNQEPFPGIINDAGLVVLPKMVGCSSEFLKADGIYLVNNGEVLAFIIGKNADSQFVSQVWGIETVDDLAQNEEYWNLRDLENEENFRVLAIVEEVRRRSSGCYLPLVYYFLGIGDGAFLRRVMTEDNTSTEFSYPDFLMRMHKVVLSKSRKDN